MAYHLGLHSPASLSPAPMPDNPQAPQAGNSNEFDSPGSSLGKALPGYRVLALAGRDAATFAQAQFMNDVDSLAPGHWHWSGWLTPKGRVVALFALLRIDDETLWLLLPDADPAVLAGELRRFVFRSKLSISARDDLFASGALAAPLEASGARLAGDCVQGLELDFGGDGGPRRLRIDDRRPTDDPALATRWSGFDLSHGLPRLDPSQAEQWTPQQLSLQRLQAYSVKKGCYPGQEIVARTHFLGQAKRGLVLVEGDAPIAQEGEVRDGEEVVGRMVSAAGMLGLAVLPLDRQFTHLSLDGNALRERPLQGGLER